jgi:hypothetical protein
MRWAGAVTEWADDPPPIDAADYELWRCTTVDCGAEIKRKRDGSASRDPRWAVPLAAP